MLQENGLGRHNSAPRLAVVGIGNELRGDDAAGIAAERALQHLADKQLNAAGHAQLLFLDAGLAPENFTGPLRRFAPDLVFLVDAVQMDEEPGTVRCLAWQDTVGFSASTHTLPPYFLANFLARDLGCEICLIGIQPADNSFRIGLSPEVTQAVEYFVHTLASILALRNLC